MRLKKPESTSIQGMCVICKVCKQTSRGKGNYRPVCSGCHKERTKGVRHDKLKTKPYIVHKKDICELCGFVPVHSCQLDVDHIDGNHDNNDISNLQTLCANCHRLKTYINKDWIQK